MRLLLSVHSIPEDEGWNLQCPLDPSTFYHFYFGGVERSKDRQAEEAAEKRSGRERKCYSSRSMRASPGEGEGWVGMGIGEIEVY